VHLSTFALFLFYFNIQHKDTIAMPNEKQRTLAIIKPDAVSKKCSGKIIDMIESQGLSIIGMKMVRLSKEKASKFYAIHASKSFFGELTDFMSSGKIVVCALEAPEAISRWRTLMGATDPAKAADGTIRKLFGSTVSVNACHGSDAAETAHNELMFFFNSNELYA
jgi:nucleoside-diphosphate kinase